MAWTGTSSTRPPAAPSAVATPTVQAPAGTIFDPNDSASPFYLHPSENPSLILVSTVLDGCNYHPWARAMEMSLLSKNKLGFVDSTIAMPDVNDVKFPYWKRCNNMVSTWITRSVSTEIAQTILWLGTAERIWKVLKARFSEDDIFRVSALHAEVHQVKQGDLSLSSYFAKLQVLWDELQKAPKLNHLKTFGCLVYALMLNGHKSKFESRSRKCVFLGYPNGVKGYKLYDLKTREVFISRDAVFYENIFPYNTVKSSNAQAPHSEIILPVVAPIEDIIPPNVHSPNISPSTNNLADIPAVETTEASQQEQQQLRRSSRQVSRPAYLNDYSCNSSATRTSPHALSTVMSYDKTTYVL
nr:uncharacterized protein LOC109192811 [Ipomoea batatas]